MYKDVGKRIIALVMCVCMMFGLADFSVLTAKAAGDISSATVTLSRSTFGYDGTEHSPDVTVVLGGTTLTETTDYTVERPDDCVSAGTKTITITGTGEYTGTKQVTYTVTPKVITSSDITITLLDQKINDDGSAITLELGTDLIVSDNGSELQGKLESDYQADTDTSIDFTYKLNGSYVTANNAASITITGRNNYQGQVNKTFKISNKSILEDVDITGLQDVSYTGSGQSFIPTITLTDKATGNPLTVNDDYLITFAPITTRAGEVTVTITGQGKYTDTFTGKYKIIKSIENFPDDFTTSTIAPQIFTGAPITIPNLQVFDGKVRLTEGKDYTLEYSNNINVGDNSASVAVVGKADSCYTGTKVFYFSIKPGGMAGADITIEEDCVYKIGPQQPKPIVKYNGVLINDWQYTVEYSNNTNAGTGKIKVTGLDNNSLYGDKEITFQILPKNLSDADGTISVHLSQDKYIYDGAEKRPTVTVAYTPDETNSEELVEGRDYTLAYYNNKNAGPVNTAAVEITGKGNYTGTYVKNFTIEGIDITGRVSVTGIKENVDYTGMPILQTGMIVKYDGKVLQNGVDYEVSYENNTEVGTATVLIQGKGNYSGSHSATFTINQKSLKAAGITCQLEFSTKPFTYSEITPTVTLKNRVDSTLLTLLENTDYTVTYSNNINVGTATVTITGMGNFKDSIERTFTITPMNLRLNDAKFTLEGLLEYYVFEGSAMEPAGLSLVYEDGQVLNQGSEYTLTFSNNTEPGTGTITINAVADSNFTGSITRPFYIKGDLTVEGEFSEIADQVYTGEAIELEDTDISVKYTYNGSVLQLGKDFIFTNYLSNTEPGVASVNIEGAPDGKYCTTGTITKDFNILKKDLDNETVEGKKDKIQLTVAEIPAQEYTGAPIYPELNITYNGYSLIKDADYEILVDESVCTNTTSTTEETYLTIQGIGDHFQGKITVDFVINKRNLENGTVTVDGLDDERIYKGTPITIETPEAPLSFTFEDGNGLTLTSDDVEYTHTYENNNQVGTATLVITGTGDNFTGTVRKDFIIKGDLSNTEHSEVTVAEKVYTGSPVTLGEEDITITHFGQELKYGVDFTLDYAEGSNINAGETVSFTINGAGDFYIGQDTGRTFVINKKPIDAEDIVVNGIDPEGYTYTGEEIHPEISLVYGTLDVALDQDYTISYENVTNVVEDWENVPDEQKPSIIVTATEGNYTGTRRIVFKINPQSLNVPETVAKDIRIDTGGATLTDVIDENFSIEYAGQPIVFEGLTVTWNGRELVQSTIGENGELIKNDYSVSYEVDRDENGRFDNDEVGTGYLVITGHGNYADTKEFPFLITGDLSNGHTAVAEIAPQPYTMLTTDPKVSITYYGQLLKEGKDYELSYANNDKVARVDQENLENSPTVFITGLGGFAGTGTKAYFEIVVRDLANNEDGMMVLEGLREEGYPFTGSPIEPDGLVLKNNGYVVEPDQYEISYENNIHGGGPESANPPYIVIKGKYNEITGEGGNYKGVMKVPFTIVGTPINNNSEITFSNPADQYYDGTAKEPMVTVTHKGRQLTFGTEYTVAWENNIAAAKTSSPAAPTIIVTGIGDYSGEVRIHFNIHPRSFADFSREFTVNIPDETYTGSAIIPKVEVKYLDKTLLVEGVDYKIEAGTNNVNAGKEATVRITGMGNYSDSMDVKFQILPKSIQTDTLVIAKVEDKVFNTKPQTQDPVVKLDGVTLAKEDYVLEYKNNVNVGKATVIVKGAGNYTGSAAVDFKITPFELTNEILQNMEIPDQAYTGSPITPNPTIIYVDKENGINYTLVVGKDYKLSYQSNIQKGKDTAIVKVTGINNFSGSITGTFTIKDNIAHATVAPIPVQEYTGKAITPNPTITYQGRTLVKDRDYTLSYKNNIQPGTATVIITGIGEDFVGTKNANFNIMRDITGGLTVVGIGDTYLYTGSPIVPNLGMVSAYGTVLKKDKDYKVTLINNVNVGVATLTVQGMGIYRGSKSFKFNIAKRSLAQCNVSNITSKTYTGKALKPKVTVSFAGKVLVQNRDYTVTYKENLLPGTANVIVKGIGNFASNQKLSFKINLPKVSKLKGKIKKNGKVVLRWGKKKIATGYQIYNENNKKVVQIKKKNKKTYILSKAKAAKSNVYKIRIYIKKGKKKYYSDFSKEVILSSKLSKPSITVSSPKAKNVKITWEKVVGAKGYEIHRSTKKDSGYKKVATTSKLKYNKGNLKRDAGYYYKVRAYKVVKGKKQYSDFSAEEYVIIK